MTRKKMNQTGLSVVLGSYNRKKYIKHTIDSIRKETESCDFPVETIVVDGGSSDGTIEWLTQQKDIITLIQHNRGEWRGKKIAKRSWGYFMNLGFQCAQGKYICMISDDSLFVPGALSNGYKQFEQLLREGSDIGALAFYWREYPLQRGNEYWVGVTFGEIFVNHGMYLREALQSIDYIDEDNFQFYHADGDLCLRLVEQGYSVKDADASFVEHYSHANLKIRSQNNTTQQNDFAHYKAKWFSKVGEKEELIGSALYRNYDDPSNAVRVYARIENSLRNRGFRLLMKALRKIRSITHK